MSGRFFRAVILAATAAILNAQDTRPQFEVASIKPSAGGPGSMFGSRGPGMFNTENTPFKMLMSQAYGVKGFQISGGPSWINSDGYTITAKESGEGTPRERFARMMLMLQVLLEDRFQLRFHRETKDMPIYALTVAKSGKLPPADCVPFDEKNRPAARGRPAADSVLRQYPRIKKRPELGSGRDGDLNGRFHPMAEQYNRPHNR